MNDKYYFKQTLNNNKKTVEANFYFSINKKLDFLEKNNKEKIITRDDLVNIIRNNLFKIDYFINTNKEFIKNLTINIKEDNSELNLDEIHNGISDIDLLGKIDLKFNKITLYIGTIIKLASNLNKSSDNLLVIDDGYKINEIINTVLIHEIFHNEFEEKENKNSIGLDEISKTIEKDTYLSDKHEIYTRFQTFIFQVGTIDKAFKFIENFYKKKNQGKNITFKNYSFEGYPYSFLQILLYLNNNDIKILESLKKVNFKYNGNKLKGTKK